MTARAGASIAEHPIYPYYCRTLSATLGRWCPLTARDVHALDEVDGFAGQDVYFYKNHMIKYVRLTGVIVAVDEFPGRVVYTLDDSSGVNIGVTCAAPLKPDAKEGGTTNDLEVASVTTKPVISETQSLISPDGPNLTGVDVGSVVKVKGGIGIFRDQKQIRLKVITLIGDTNAEVKCWNDVVKFRGDILTKPWVVSEKDQEKCRLEVDREARWKLEEEAKQKKEELRRHLKKRGKEMQRESNAEQENVGDRDDGVKKRDIKDKQGEGSHPENRVNYHSMAARRRAAGKYDALGI